MERKKWGKSFKFITVDQNLSFIILQSGLLKIVSDLPLSSTVTHFIIERNKRSLSIFNLCLSKPTFHHCWLSVQLLATIASFEHHLKLDLFRSNISHFCLSKIHISSQSTIGVSWSKSKLFLYILFITIYYYCILTKIQISSKCSQYISQNSKRPGSPSPPLFLLVISWKLLFSDLQAPDLPLSQTLFLSVKISNQ